MHETGDASSATTKPPRQTRILTRKPGVKRDTFSGERCPEKTELGRMHQEINAPAAPKPDHGCLDSFTDTFNIGDT